MSTPDERRESADIIPASQFARGLSLDDVPWRCPTIILAHPTSLNTSTPQGRATLINCTGPADVRWEDAADTEFLVSDYVVTDKESESRTDGERYRHPYTVLISPDGQTLSSDGDYIPARLAAVVAVEGQGPWNPPIRVIPRVRKSKRMGQTYHDFHCLPRDYPDQE